MIPITGYADKYSVAPGDSLDFKISMTPAGSYKASLVRLISGDPNPAGIGLKNQTIDAAFAGSYDGIHQPVPLGSYVTVPIGPAVALADSFTLMATIWPTLPDRAEQAIISRRDAQGGFTLSLGDQGVVFSLQDAENQSSIVTAKPLRQRAWYRVWAIYDAEKQIMTVGQAAIAPVFKVDDNQIESVDCPKFAAAKAENLLLGASWNDGVHMHFNGKIEAPKIYSRALNGAELALAWGSEAIAGLTAAWDFSKDISTTRVLDVGPHGLHGETVNLPARAMTGANWDGSVMSWQHAPEQYGAIHFHEDDIYDCGWQNDFSYEIPADLKSGIYAVHLAGNGAEDFIPFFVRPPKGTTTAKLAVLIPTFTYMIYGNMARGTTTRRYKEQATAWGARPWTTDEDRDYGLSTYNFHPDGSGICHGSRLRPMITMRPNFVAYAEPRGSGLRHLPADLHLITWLEALGHDYDIITDEDLHAEGLELLRPYKAVMTPTHPEYHSSETLDGLQDYVDGGGRLMYLGGNGFYWRVAVHEDLPGVLEIRRGEGGIRAWAAESGEYFNAFDGGYGGLWRRNDRPPQKLVGVGFTSQGEFEGSYYRKTAAADDLRVAWMFDGIEDELLGDFGFSGGGAAGFELDRTDYRLGTPKHALVVARSEGHHENHILVPEEMLTNLLTWPGKPMKELIRADMTYFETDHGGAVFSVGSITFCGSLPHNGCDNNISKLMDNIVRRFCAEL